jgi:hypothetical protein
MQMKRRKLYANNINSPSRLLLPEAFYHNYSSDSFIADAISCYKLKDADESCGGIELNAFQVEFWDGKSESVLPILRVVIHASKTWSAKVFLRYVEKALFNYQVLSLIRGYLIDGVKFCYVTINKLHHYLLFCLWN